MTTTLIRVMHCDFAGCTAQVPNDSNGYVKDRPDGWTDLIYTHGCPEHGQAVAAHQATITSDTRGRGSREKTTWFLACACGWRPTPPYQAYSADSLKKQHLAHVHRETTR